MFREGKFIRGRTVDIISNDAAIFKIGFTVSRKIKGSTRKNKFKRRMREIYRNHKEYFPNQKHIILHGKQNDTDYFSLKEEILSLIIQIK